MIRTILFFCVLGFGACVRTSSDNALKQGGDTDTNGTTSGVSTFKGKARHKEDISIYVDYKIPSYAHRFFVYDNHADTVISESKCAHGCGGGSTISKPVFSNKPGSECSSLGEYRLRAVSTLNNSVI